jgi:protocatechuate 3,4-dioxygenase beta subunit
MSSPPPGNDSTKRISRREAIAAAGALGVGAGAWVLLRDGGGESAASTSTRSAGSSATAERPAPAAKARCVLTPEQTEGPYYIDEGLVRRDVTEGRTGMPLRLRLRVEDASSCGSIHGATVEIWHADAEGVYSGFGAGAGETFLRGAQRTNRDGLALFTTIYPGWYQGRTTHIHVKVHAGGEVVHTGQLYFKDSATDAVYETSPYSSRAERDTTNATDGIYAGGGAESMLKLEHRGGGYVGRLAMGVQA